MSRGTFWRIVITAGGGGALMFAAAPSCVLVQISVSNRPSVFCVSQISLFLYNLEIVSSKNFFERNTFFLIKKGKNVQKRTLGTNGLKKFEA